MYNFKLNLGGGIRFNENQYFEWKINENCVIAE